MIKYWLSALIILLNSITVSAEELQIVVVGLFDGHAVIELDGKQMMLKAGKETAEGIKLISADSQQAIIEVNGKQVRYELGNQVSTDYGPEPDQAEVSIWPKQGMYFTTGSINGYSVDFLVDTGATTVALNANTAKRLGIDFQKGTPVSTQTASGGAHGYLIVLDTVQLGDIKLHNIEAIVHVGNQPPFALLGMSFLNRLEVRHDGERMDLKQKY